MLPCHAEKTPSLRTTRLMDNQMISPFCVLLELAFGSRNWHQPTSEASTQLIHARAFFLVTVQAHTRMSSGSMKEHNVSSMAIMVESMKVTTTSHAKIYLPMFGSLKDMESSSLRMPQQLESSNLKCLLTLSSKKSRLLSRTDVATRLTDSN